MEGGVVPVRPNPEHVGKVADICGLYLAPPGNTNVQCVDELGRTEAR